MPLSGVFGYFGQREANKTNIKLAEQARQHDVSMWERTNQYNTPQMQMQRFKEAGLNPNLIYGQGSEGNASQAPKAPIPEVQNELASLSQMSALPVISMYQDWRVKNAQIDNLEAQAAATKQNAALTALRQTTQEYTNQRLGDEKHFWYDNAKEKSYQIQGQSQLMRFKAQTAQKMFNEALPTQIKSIILRNNLLDQQIKGQRLENDLNEKLKPFGASSRDPLLQRLIMMIMSPKSGSKGPNILNDPLGHLKYSIKHPFGK